jgi:2-dehydro-3-deoxyphosphogalactonate aldolase
MELTGWLKRCPLIAILRGVRPEEVEDIAAVLEQARIVIIEVPLNSPQPLDSVARLARSFGDRLLIGAGTVMTEAQVSQIVNAGARLVVTPHAVTEIVRAAKQRGLLTIPGFFTPTEALSLLTAGADALKLFPAEAASPAVLRAIRAVLPQDTSILPVGGIETGNMAGWRAAGAAGFGIGSSIYRPGDSAAIVAKKARALIAALHASA